MIRIGICDDCKTDSLLIQQWCETFFKSYKVDYEYIIFYSGEEVLDYCRDNRGKEKRIDLLFLDIEMGEISGIELKNKILKENNIWRIVFASSHLESMHLAFGLKTMGFAIKPVKEEEIHKWIKIVVEDKQEEVLVEIPKCSLVNEKYVLLEDIAYVKANGNYSEIYHIEDLHISGLNKKAPAWCKVSEHLLRTGEISHRTVLAKAMELCRDELVECNWPNVPEKYWDLAVKQMIGE